MEKFACIRVADERARLPSNQPHFSALDDDCLLWIFRKFTLAELCDALEIWYCFRNVARQEFTMRANRMSLFRVIQLRILSHFGDLFQHVAFLLDLFGDDWDANKTFFSLI